MAFQIHDSEQVAISAQAVDSEGNPADATVAFTSSDPSVIEVQDAGNGTALLVASPGEGGLGTAIVTATVTNGDGTVIEGTVEVEVVAGDAVIVNIEFGAAEPKPVL
jgi:hypothetical protein